MFKKKMSHISHSFFVRKACTIPVRKLRLKFYLPPDEGNVISMIDGCRKFEKIVRKKYASARTTNRTGMSSSGTGLGRWQGVQNTGCRRELF